MNTNLFILPDLIACATCLGDPGSKSSQAQGNAILFMLILLACVLGTFIYTMINLGRRQRKVLAQRQNQFFTP